MPRRWTRHLKELAGLLAVPVIVIVLPSSTASSRGEATRAPNLPDLTESGTHRGDELQVVHDKEGEVGMLYLEPPGAGLQIAEHQAGEVVEVEAGAHLQREDADGSVQLDGDVAS